MSTPIKNGGPAFPQHAFINSNNEVVTPSSYFPDVSGISIRDYFAGQALNAIVSQAKLNPCGDFVADDCLLQHYKAPEFAATVSYQFADAMIAARDGKEVKP